MEAKKISKNLAILYREFMDKPGLHGWFAEYLPDVMFTQEIRCDNPNIVSVVVVHKELEEEVTTALNNGRAYMQLYTDNANIFLNDTFGNRYAVSIKYNRHLCSTRGARCIGDEL